MSVTAAENLVLDNFTAVEFLADGGGGRRRKPVLLMNVSWAEYEHFLEDFKEKAGWHLAYDEGFLEIMPPLMEHEASGRAFDMFVRAYCDHFDLTLQSAGSTTFRRKSKEKGIEPDSCYYVQNADKVIGRDDLLSPENYPAPDVAVEIDITHGSLDKFKIYAALGVPELWIYDGSEVNFHRLEGDIYHQTEFSLALPVLSSGVLTGFLKLSREKGQTAALKGFRAWLSEQKTKSEPQA